MSFSGETSELLTLLPFIKRFELPIISMTGNTGSSWPNTRISFWTRAFRGSLPAEPGPTSSTTAMLVMGRRPRHGPGGSAPLHRGTSPNATRAVPLGVPCSPG
ncbi:MAG: hypothetical protein ACLSUW_04465 [Akkermansia sp.]